MTLYRHAIRPLLFRFDPALMHDVFTHLGRGFGTLPPARATLRALYAYSHPKLEQELHGIRFRNPVGLAAGFDKECRLIRVMEAVGFGFVEVGSITARPYKGNAGKHMVRLPKDESMVIYYGLKTTGARNLAPRLARSHPLPVGVSVAKTNTRHETEEARLADWVDGVRMLKDAGDYVTLNTSCPNTYDPVSCSEPSRIRALLRAIEETGVAPAKPLFLKLPSDVPRAKAEEILTICEPHDWVTGFIVSNLLKQREKAALRSPKHLYEEQPGGLSGKPLRPHALSLLKHLYRKGGERFTFIGCGGIFTAEDAYEYIRAGASLVQLITGMIFEGPGVVGDINKGLVRLLDRNGYGSVAEAVGTLK